MEHLIKKNSNDVDLSYVFKAAKEIAKCTKNKKIIITKSTVPVGTGDEIEKLLKKLKKKYRCNFKSRIFKRR